MKLTNTLKRVLSVVVLLMLVAALALGMTACTNDTVGETSSNSSAQSQPQKVGEGATEFAFSVTDKQGATKEFIVCTDKTTVGDALLEVGLIEGEDSAYGLFVKKVDGIVADYDIDKTYWAFYVDGQYASSGVDTTEIVTTNKYSFKVEK